MIQTVVLEIESLETFDRLLNIIPKTHIDQSVINAIKDAIGIRCKAIVVESPYYESDYLSSYYIFYAKKMQRFPKECCRLLLFADKYCSQLIGCISLRPTYEGMRLGRTFIEPQYILSEPAYMILGDQKVHFQGGEATLQVFPHMKQEGDIAVCAHVALWSVIRSFTNRFHMYQEVRLGELVKLAQSDVERRIPSTGLSAPQIAEVFVKLGFSSLICTNTKENSQECLDIILGYIDSGIPVIGISSAWKHAVAIIGHGANISISWDEIFKKKAIRLKADETQQNESFPEVLFSSKLVRDIIVNDDNFFPYRVVSRVPSRSETQGANDEISQRFKMQDFDYAVIPLYPRIQLGYDNVRSLFLGLVETGIYNWAKRIVVRPFLASANTYREYVNMYGTAFGGVLKNILIGIELPKFVWCVEVSTPDSYEKKRINAIVLIDSTSATVNKEPYLLITERDKIRYSDGGQPKEYTENVSLLNVPSFNLNLEEVSPIGPN